MLNTEGGCRSHVRAVRQRKPETAVAIAIDAGSTTKTFVAVVALTLGEAGPSPESHQKEALRLCGGGLDIQLPQKFHYS